MRRALIIASLLLLPFAPTKAQGDDVPYWVSLKVDKANMRVGPDRSYPVEWIFVRRHVPLKVVRKSGGWRLVEDRDGERGWLLARFLTRERTAMVTSPEPASIHAEPSAAARLLWRAEAGAIGALGECSADWCEISFGERKGWIEASAIWGEGTP